MPKTRKSRNSRRMPKWFNNLRGRTGYAELNEEDLPEDQFVLNRINSIELEKKRRNSSNERRQKRLSRRKSIGGKKRKSKRTRKTRR